MAWLQATNAECTFKTTLQRAQWVDRFLCWLAARQAITSNPFAELRERYGCRRTASIVRALLSPNPTEVLKALRPPPRYGSHLGPAMREHVRRMRTLGFRYGHESRFWRFDIFLQRRRGARREPLSTLVREYVALAPSASEKVQRIGVARVLARALHRNGIPTALPKQDRRAGSGNAPKTHPPLHLQSGASEPAPGNCVVLSVTACPAASPVLSTRCLLAYCAGLRVGEIISLKLQDLDLAAGTIEVRNAKFFKSRRLPLSSSALSALRDYLDARRSAGVPEKPTASLFWNYRRPYSYITAETLLRQVIRRAGLNAVTGRGGPRVHDLRHTFVVHRMTAWYRQGVSPQNRLPYLAAYLAHKDIHSNAHSILPYYITQELLQHASDRFHAAESGVMKAIQGIPL